mgnify:CR=1 FL=1
MPARGGCSLTEAGVARRVAGGPLRRALTAPATAAAAAAAGQRAGGGAAAGAVGAAGCGQRHRRRRPPGGQVCRRQRLAAHHRPDVLHFALGERGGTQQAAEVLCRASGAGRRELCWSVRRRAGKGMSSGSGSRCDGGGSNSSGLYVEAAAAAAAAAATAVAAPRTRLSAPHWAVVEPHPQRADHPSVEELALHDARVGAHDLQRVVKEWNTAVSAGGERMPVCVRTASRVWMGNKCSLPARYAGPQQPPGSPSPHHTPLRPHHHQGLVASRPPRVPATHLQHRLGEAVPRRWRQVQLAAAAQRGPQRAQAGHPRPQHEAEEGDELDRQHAGTDGRPAQEGGRGGRGAWDRLGEHGSKKHEEARQRQQGHQKRAGGAPSGALQQRCVAPAAPRSPTTAHRITSLAPRPSMTAMLRPSAHSVASVVASSNPPSSARL